MSEEGNIVKKVFGKAADKYGSIPAGPALLYLIRRFGYTEWGGDDHKEVCCYFLPTEISELYVSISVKWTNAWVSSSFSDGGEDSLYWACETEARRPYQEWHERCRGWVAAQGRSFSGNIRPTDEDEELREAYKTIEPFPPNYIEPEPGSLRHKVLTAFEEALRDLLRPVFVRDVPINIMGKVEPVWSDKKEAYDIDLDLVKPHWTAGKGMVLEPYRDHDLFLDFLHVTRERGGGDLFAGMKLALVGTQHERPLPSPVGDCPEETA